LNLGPLCNADLCRDLYFVSQTSTLTLVDLRADHTATEAAASEPAATEMHCTTATKSDGRFSTTKQSGWNKELCRDI
jgi:hypothetical protein